MTAIPLPAKRTAQLRPMVPAPTHAILSIRLARLGMVDHPTNRIL
jgi:hypothetical protein